MKHKIFLIVLVCLFTLGTAVLADYVDPTGTPSNYSTPNVLKTSIGGTQTTYEKVGTWEYTNNPPSSSDVASFDSQAKDLLRYGSYAGNQNHQKGLFSEKLTVLGSTIISSGDLLTMVDNKSNSYFDQYINGVTFVYPDGTSPKMGKALEGKIFARMLGKIVITDNADNGSQPLYPAQYTLDLQATTGTNAFKPTTNIGLGDKCNLYPRDIGTKINDGANLSYGGCPVGSYISYYKAPSFSGTISSTNNTNSQVVAVCTEFNPSASPTNKGACFSNAIASIADGPGYRCNDSTSMDYNKVDYRNVYSFCDDGNNPGNKSQTGMCEIWSYPKNAKNPQIRRIVNGGTPSSYQSLTTSGYSYIFSCTDTVMLQIIDDYGQYLEGTN